MRKEASDRAEVRKHVGKVRDALVALAKAGAKAYVFDLRGDGGGYESAAVHVASDHRR